MKSPYENPDYHALVRRIREIDRAGGDSTLARLVTADWLEDHGEEERAEFVRTQVRYAIIHADDTPERDELSEMLLARFVIRVATPTPFAPDCPNRMWPEEIHVGVPREWDWLSGWLSAVRCPLAWWLAHGPDLCRRHPVREVVITGDYIRLVDAADWRPRRYLTWFNPPGDTPAPEMISTVLADIAYGRPRQTEQEVRVEVSAAYLKWAEHEADTTPEGRA
jgi:uncharacterized protein (TIGR02996 family)